MIVVTVAVDEARMERSGEGQAAEAEVLALLETMKVDGRLRLESTNFWLPVKDLSYRPVRATG